jgi:hypothetical protein
MNHQDELDVFVEKWGGRTRVIEQIESAISSPSGQFAEELSALVAQNPHANKVVTEFTKVATEVGQLGSTVMPSFAGTPSTHGTSVADDFFKAKSQEYLCSAELAHDNEAAARNEDDGWPDDGRDIGDA